MLADADSRAAEIITAATASAQQSAWAAGGGGGKKGEEAPPALAFTVLGMRTHLEPVPKYRPFVQWMLRDKCAAFKR